MVAHGAAATVRVISPGKLPSVRDPRWRVGPVTDHEQQAARIAVPYARERQLICGARLARSGRDSPRPRSFAASAATTSRHCDRLRGWGGDLAFAAMLHSRTHGRTDAERAPPFRGVAGYRDSRRHRWRQREAGASRASVSRRRKPISRPCLWSCSIMYPLISSWLRTTAGKSIPPARSSSSVTGCSPARRSRSSIRSCWVSPSAT